MTAPAALARDTMTGDVGKALWNPQAHMPSARAKRLVITGGDGAWLTTSTGQRLLDATASLWHANIGHGRERIARAAYDQMRKLETYHTFGRFANEPALRLADRLVALGPTPDAKVMLTSGGSDSVDLACKLARRHWQLEGRGQKKTILSRHRAYHGLHAFGTSIAGLQYNRDGYRSRRPYPHHPQQHTADLPSLHNDRGRGRADSADHLARPRRLPRLTHPPTTRSTTMTTDLDLTRYKALSFDCYGTLIDWEAGIAAVLAPWAREQGLDLTDEDLLLAYADNEAAVERETPAAL